MEWLKWEDQELIRQRILELKDLPDDFGTPKSAVPKIEHAKSSAGKCFKCKEKIEKGQIRETNDFTKDASSIVGFELLDESEKNELKELFQLHRQRRNEKLMRMRMSGNNLRSRPTFCGMLVSSYRKNCQKLNGRTSGSQWTYQVKKGGIDAVLDQVWTGKLLFNSAMHAYKCKGHATEYAPCPYSTKNPARTSFKIPSDIFENHKFLSKLKKPLLTNRVYPELAEKEKVINPIEQSTSFAKYNPAAKKRKLLESGAKKLLVKNGCVVDEKCDVAEETHVYIDPVDKLPWQATLGASDFQSNKTLFISYSSLKLMMPTHITCFVHGEGSGLLLVALRRKTLDKTRNEWADRHNFKKSPYGMNIIELDFDAKEDIAINNLNEFEIDMKKMPLGKLKRCLQKSPPTQTDFLDATNRFYTLIPHNTGLSNPPLLNSRELIKTKSEILDNLLEMEVAFKIIKSETEDTSIVGKDLFDVHFEKLNCKMEVVDKQSEEFALVKKYAENTHGATHDSYKLDIVDVIKLDRADEAKKFRGDIGNTYLLWHGSRTSNYVGILKQGLRIAPPEAPVTGYMFGKGIYTADMVSKSANYCHAIDTDGLLVLCEVALGDIQEEKKAKNIRRLKGGKNSVKGLGGTVPDPEEFVVKDGVTIPCGKPIASDQKGLELLYNEFIVYNEEQVRMKYLVRAKFIQNVDF
uniref:Poly [ADP-ribose] polymerase n=1 Tax=Ditylenchus dipsaci TaxID=166011 RepID=A0A915DT11_9BILA